MPTANNSPAKKEETPGVKRAECQMVLVYAHVFAAVKRNDVLVRIGEQIQAEFRLNPIAQQSLKIELCYFREHNILT